MYLLALARQEAEWNRTVAIMATVLNLFAKTPIDPESPHPMKREG